MMDYISAGAQGFPSACDLQQLAALAALAATLTTESTARGISHGTFFAPSSSCSLGSCFTGDARGGGGEDGEYIIMKREAVLLDVETGSGDLCARPISIPRSQA